jgi:hypothetical protein
MSSTAELPLRASADGIRIALRVTPKSHADRIVGVGRDAAGRAHLAIRLRAAPEAGRANEAAIALIARSLGIPKASLEVVSGAAARSKTIFASGDPAMLQARMADLIDGLKG